MMACMRKWNAAALIPSLASISAAWKMKAWHNTFRTLAAYILYIAIMLVVENIWSTISRTQFRQTQNVFGQISIE